MKYAKNKLVAGAAATVTAAGLLTLGVGTPASAGSCGQVVNASVSGGQASWSHSCSGGNIRVFGWVKDTRSDGKCAQVKAQYSNGTQWSNKACPKDEVEYFDFVGPGSSVPVYLFTV
ncbi:hypothetical protein [Streptomyces acidiscabies]|uniref:hypothetical protein n=1 Tax=Streptomyces acidiscabies TaxID=42234 RepID=UPI0038F75AF3